VVYTGAVAMRACAARCIQMRAVYESSPRWLAEKCSITGEQHRREVDLLFSVVQRARGVSRKPCVQPRDVRVEGRGRRARAGEVACGERYARREREKNVVERQEV